MNTIYDGSFVLGQTSATNFQAGPGIKIDSPSAGTVRIGNDETVLWSGTLNYSQTANLSESVQNFEKIKVYTHESQRKRNLVSEYETDYFNTQPMIAVCIPDIENANSKSWFSLYWSRLYFTDTACSAIVNNGGMQTWWDSKANAALNVVKDRYCIVDKIVGINRISGGNE